MRRGMKVTPVYLEANVFNHEWMEKVHDTVYKHPYVEAEDKIMMSLYNVMFPIRITVEDALQ